MEAARLNLAMKAKIRNLPVLAPMEQVVEFRDEVDAIEYCVAHALRTDRSLTREQIAIKMKINKGSFTKMCSGVIGIPVRRAIAFARVTGSLAYLQYLAWKSGAVVLPHEKYQSMKDDLERAKQQSEFYRKQAMRLYEIDDE